MGQLKAAGLWLNTNLNHHQMMIVMREACEAAGVRWSFLMSFE